LDNVKTGSPLLITFIIEYVSLSVTIENPFSSTPFSFQISCFTCVGIGS